MLTVLSACRLSLTSFDSVTSAVELIMLPSSSNSNRLRLLTLQQSATDIVIAMHTLVCWCCIGLLSTLWGHNASDHTIYGRCRFLYCSMCMVCLHEELLFAFHANILVTFVFDTAGDELGVHVRICDCVVPTHRPCLLYDYT